MLFLSTILPWVWLSLGALCGFFVWRGNQRALPLMWMFLALFGAEFIGSWMAHRSIPNVWFDRMLTLGVTGVIVGRVHPGNLWIRWGFLTLTFAISCLMSGSAVFGFLAPISIFILVSWHCWIKLRNRLQGRARGGIWASTGCAAWTWISVFKMFEDYVAVMGKEVFINYWIGVNLAIILCLCLFVWDAYASNTSK